MPSQPSCHLGVPTLYAAPPGPARITLILAHGAGAPMDSPFMDAISRRLVLREVAVLRFEFPYMAARRLDARRRPPNPQAQLLDSWRALYGRVRAELPGPLAIGGKSMGGRLASLLADALQPSALVCLGYPFHPAGKPERTRIAHLADLRTPTLIVQGERDALGNRAEVAGYALSPHIECCWLAAADHDLKPTRRSGIEPAAHLDSAAQRIAAFLAAHCQEGPARDERCPGLVNAAPSPASNERYALPWERNAMNDRNDTSAPSAADEPDVTMVDAGERAPDEDPDFEETDPQDRDRDS